jgi:hypothetical protein
VDGASASEAPVRRYGRDGRYKHPRLETDRPDFTEASSTVGYGVAQYEAGYTLARATNGSTRISTHTAPEALFRIGVLAEWFELRIGYTYLWEKTETLTGSSLAAGSDDLYLGVKLALTLQDGWLPEMSIVPQMSVPLGAEFSADQCMPGINWLYGWDVTETLSLGGTTQINRAVGTIPVFADVGGGNFVQVGEHNHYHLQFEQGATAGIQLTERLGFYGEWFVLVPLGALEASGGPQHYVNGGFRYQPTPNLQFDIRHGVGLSKEAADFFSGIGLSQRF